MLCVRAHKKETLVNVNYLSYNFSDVRRVRWSISFVHLNMHQDLGANILPLCHFLLKINAVDTTKTSSYKKPQTAVVNNQSTWIDPNFSGLVPPTTQQLW
jgi:hypothetical protein